MKCSVPLTILTQPLLHHSQVRALTEARDALAQELSSLRGSKQTLEAALTSEKERALQLENEKVGKAAFLHD